MLHISYGDVNFDACNVESELRNRFPSKASQDFIDLLIKKGNEKAKAQSLFAYLGLASLLEENGIDTKALDISRTREGKPYFENSDIFFSISHTDKYFAVAIANSAVGIDIESKCLTDKKMQSIAKRYFLPDEIDYVCDRDTFLEVWTFKEAYAKKIGAPLSGTMSNVSVTDDSIKKIYKKYNDAIICVCM